jgi:hypothetical protein
MASGLTPTYLLPYPLQTDPVNVASDVEDLATAVETELLLKSPLASPTFTGTPAAPTAASDTSTTQIATTQFVVNQGYIKSAAVASTYAPLISPALSGTPTAPTAAVGTDTTQIATTAFVQNELENFVTLPSQSGNNGRFLTTNGTSANWKQLEISDISTLNTVLYTDFPAQYSPKNLSTTASATSYTLTLADAARVIEMSGGGTLTIPTNASVALPIGTQIVILQITSSQVTIAGESGVTVNGTPGLKLRAQWSSATLIKRSANIWVALGDLAA